MPQYFFHVYDGTLLFDDEGTSLPDLDHAKAHATRAALGAFKDRVGDTRTQDDWLMEVADADGHMLFRFVLNTCEIPRISMKLTIERGKSLVN